MLTRDRHVDDLPEWRVDGADFPVGAPIHDAVSFMLRFAILAPSPHNTQPWRFRIEGREMTLGLDHARALAVCDPFEREATISAGAAFLNFRVAAARFGFGVATQRWPGGASSSWVARASVTDGGAPDAELASLFDGITRRVTSRYGFSNDDVPATVIDQLRQAARSEGVHVKFVADHDIRRSSGANFAPTLRTSPDSPDVHKSCCVWATDRTASGNLDARCLASSRPAKGARDERLATGLPGCVPGDFRHRGHGRRRGGGHSGGQARHRTHGGPTRGASPCPAEGERRSPASATSPPDVLGAAQSSGTTTTGQRACLMQETAVEPRRRPNPRAT